MPKVAVAKPALPVRRERQAWLKFGHCQFQPPEVEVLLSCNQVKDKSPICICPQLGHDKTRNHKHKEEQQMKLFDSTELIETEL